MSVQWLLFLHVASVLALLATHGASMAVLYAIRKEHDRARIMAMVQLSGRTTVPMYVSILLIVVFGSLLAFKLHMWEETWLWLSIAILVATIALMNVVAKPYFRKIKEACQLRPSGVPRISDEELADVVASSIAHLISLIGALGLLSILYLMIFTPF
jgi:cytochrome bd-type quinol oxidase subunit 2